MSKQYRIALLIDAENISRKYIKLIMDEISEYGIITHKRVYGDFSNPTVLSWKESLIDFAMTPVFQFNYTKGKNASDSAMVIDAMDILYSGKVDGFCLVTSDSDFTKLAIRLKEAGMLVIGMGEEKTPTSLVAACETFKYLDLLFKEETKNAQKVQTDISNGKNMGGENKQETSKEKAAPQEVSCAKEVSDKVAVKQGIPKKSQIQSEIESIVTSRSNEDGWVNLAEVGNLLSKRIPGFDPRNYGFKKLKDLVECMNIFQMQIMENTKNPLLKIVYIKRK